MTALAIQGGDNMLIRFGIQVLIVSADNNEKKDGLIQKQGTERKEREQEREREREREREK